jgi:uncharacterized protein (DUF697 family)
MINTEVTSAEQIVRNHVWFSAVPGLLPVPLIDLLGIAAIQVDMIKQLCHFYDKSYDEQRGKALSTALVSSMLGRLPGYALRTGLKTVPVVGWVLGGLSMSLFAGASTYATGMVFKEHFENGGVLHDLNPQSLSEFYHKHFADGRELLRRMWGWEETGGHDEGA